MNEPGHLCDNVTDLESRVAEFERRKAAPLTKADVEAVRKVVAQEIRALADDAEFVKIFWRSGFEHLSNHGVNAANQWLGKRILTMFIGSAVTLGLVWLVKTGAIK